MAKNIGDSNQPACYMIVTGIAAVIAGGMISAFLAHDPSRLAMWVSAYLVLVAGVAQVVFGLSLYKLSRAQYILHVWVAFILYNLANAEIIVGTLYKHTQYGRPMVLAGGIGMILALAYMILATKHATRSLILKSFYVFICLILACIPIGLWLSATR